MVKKLQQVGNSHAIVLDRAIREAIGLQPDDAVQITVSGDSLIITPARVGLRYWSSVNMASRRSKMPSFPTEP